VSAAPKLAVVERYDACCAFCGDGLIRYLMGIGPRDYVTPLWQRALEARGTGWSK
jgi:hypothetical protein